MKRIVICSDGTWSTPDRELPTNVTRMARAVLPTAPDGAAQVVFYDAGVGTEGSWLWRLLGGVSGRGLEKNIRDCYRFLVHNYEEGDEIYLFGFSRGAYTVRSLAGMVRNVGVLRKSDADQFRNAYRLYRRSDASPASSEAAAFRAAHSREAAITFIGVWDTVGALGIPLRRLGRLTASHHQFHDVELSGIVRHGCHALAIDEKRGPFRASLWEAKPKPGQIVEQVWFSGGTQRHRRRRRQSILVECPVRVDEVQGGGGGPGPGCNVCAPISSPMFAARPGAGALEPVAALHPGDRRGRNAIGASHGPGPL